MSQSSDFIQYSFLLVCFTFTFTLQFPLLIKCMRAKSSERLSASILINIFWWVLACFVSIFYMAYRGFLTPDQWNLPLLFFMIGINLFASNGVTGSVTFVLLDRIFILTQPIEYKKQQKWFILLAFGFCTFVGSLSVFVLLITELPLSNTANTGSNFGAVLVRNRGKYTNLVRGGVGILNIVVALVFRWVLARFNSVIALKRQYLKANRITIVSFVTELICVIIPNSLRFICEKLEIQETAILGPYPVLLFGIDALCTALIYRFIITPRFIFKRKMICPTATTQTHPGLPKSITPAISF